MSSTPTPLWPTEYYDARNTDRALVIDMDTGQRIERVKFIAPPSGLVEVYRYPLESYKGTDYLLTDSFWFRSVQVIHDRGVACLFHCYGRVS